MGRTRSRRGQDAIDEGNSGRTVVNVGIVTLAAGGAVALSGIVWQLALNRPERAARIHPVVGPHVGALVVAMRF